VPNIGQAEILVGVVIVLVIIAVWVFRRPRGDRA
jgi:hypothetical protein